jgi:hypothetical protein
MQLSAALSFVYEVSATYPFSPTWGS